MEISTDPDGTVYVRWADGGPFLVLQPGGDITTGYTGGLINWFALTPGTSSTTSDQKAST